MPRGNDISRRLLALWDHLGLGRAHIATQMPGDIAGFVQEHPDRIGSVTLCTPVRLDVDRFATVVPPLTVITGAGLITPATLQTTLPTAKVVALSDYHVTGWSDVVAERTRDVVDAFLGLPSLPAVSLPGAAGAYGGIRYSIVGEGPPLVLLPFFLAASQWEPAIQALTERFTVIVLAGRHLGGVAALEDRASGASYQAMAQTLWDRMEVEYDDQVLDVGCGSGALDRLLVKRLTEGRIVATDTNRFLLREAAALTGSLERIIFQQADAEALPFADATFDMAFSVTVLEECDADQALREMFRVLRPGGRAGVIVRAIDHPQWWNLPLEEGLRRKAAVPPQSVGQKGVADASLYRRMRQAGFGTVAGFPYLVTFDNPDGPIWHYREDHLLAQLDAEEKRAWHKATGEAVQDGLIFMAHAMHCAIGTK
jgi:ubiquinone/menaquinone biosynthesis C-methylase UbiE